MVAKSPRSTGEGNDRAPHKSLCNGQYRDVKPVGEGISELRLHFGPGYRIYFVRRGKTLIFVLAGGDKSTQARDIKAAKALAKLMED